MAGQHRTSSAPRFRGDGKSQDSLPTRPRALTIARVVADAGPSMILLYQAILLHEAASVGPTRRRSDCRAGARRDPGLGGLASNVTEESPALGWVLDIAAVMTNAASIRMARG